MFPSDNLFELEQEMNNPKVKKGTIVGDDENSGGDGR